MQQTEFMIEEDSHKMVVTRAFKAPLEMVWQAWTDSAILDAWWAPKPWKAATKTQNFAPGGTWLYAMTGPGGEKHWSLTTYVAIEPMESFTADGCFCDENANVNPDFPNSSQWHVVFTPQDGATLVTITMTFDTAEALNKMMAMGFKEGFTMAHGNLDAWILEQM